MGSRLKYGIEYFSSIQSVGNGTNLIHVRKKEKEKEKEARRTKERKKAWKEEKNNPPLFLLLLMKSSANFPALPSWLTPIFYFSWVSGHGPKMDVQDISTSRTPLPGAFLRNPPKTDLERAMFPEFSRTKQRTVDHENF